MMSQRQRILKALRGIDTQNRSCMSGICHAFIRAYPKTVNTINYLSSDLNRVKSEMTKWPKYSGEFTFPVPSGDPWYIWILGIAKSPSEAYGGKDSWNPNHRYGKLRLELLAWLIKEFGETE